MRLGSYGQKLGKFLVLLGKLLGEEFTRDARVFASGWTGRWSDRAIHLSRNFCWKEGLWKRFSTFLNVLEWSDSFFFCSLFPSSLGLYLFFCLSSLSFFPYFFRSFSQAVHLRRRRCSCLGASFPFFFVSGAVISVASV